MAEIESLNVVDASNVARQPEGMPASSVNDGVRALEGILARFHEDLGARASSTGSANAYAFVAQQTITAYYDGLLIGFDANFQNTGSATLAVDGLAATTIKKHNDQNLISGDIEAGQKVLVVYDGTNFQLLSGTAGEPALGTVGQLLLSNGANLVNVDTGFGKNVIINGNFDVWQRGTTFTAAITGTYGPDRFLWQQTGVGVVDLLQSTSVPDNASDFSYQVDVTTIDATIAATDFYIVPYRVEGYDALRFAFGASDAKALTLSFGLDRQRPVFIASASRTALRPGHTLLNIRLRLLTPGRSLPSRLLRILLELG